ncbi:MAG: M17 family peptidase N-terminal domain-containing protein [Candidatus Gracilibacteria bacterium]|nr:M17 family peptidase N-terminal domain-containing protein [Candidatus Gracilibacteria bacterium]
MDPIIGYFMEQKNQSPLEQVVIPHIQGYNAGQVLIIHLNSSPENKKYPYLLNPNSPNKPRSSLSPPMRITTHSKCDPINPTIIGLFENEKPDSGRLGKSLAELIQKHQKQKSFSGKSNESVSTHLSKGEKLQKVILFGLGEENKLHETSTRNFGAKMIRASADFQQKEINISIPPALQNHLQALAEGLIMGNYDPALYKTDEEAKKKGEKKTNTINLICTDWNTDQRSRLEKGKSVGETVNYIRTLVNSAPDQLNTEQLVREIKLTAKENQMKVTDFDKKKLEKMKMGGILAVNRGSAEPAHMMVIEYNPAPISDNRKPKTPSPSSWSEKGLSSTPEGSASSHQLTSPTCSWIWQALR